MIVPLYLAECSPPEKRGTVNSLNNLVICFGIFLAAIIDAALSKVEDGWRYMLGFAFIPAFIQMLLFIFIMPESPRFLVEANNKLGLGSEKFSPPHTENQRSFTRKI